MPRRVPRHPARAPRAIIPRRRSAPARCSADFLARARAVPLQRRAGRPGAGDGRSDRRLHDQGGAARRRRGRCCPGRRCRARSPRRSTRLYGSSGSGTARRAPARAGRGARGSAAAQRSRQRRAGDPLRQLADRPRGRRCAPPTSTSRRAPTASSQRLRIDGMLRDIDAAAGRAARQHRQPHQDHGRAQHRRAPAAAGRPLPHRRRGARDRSAHLDRADPARRERRDAAARPRARAARPRRARLRRRAARAARAAARRCRAACCSSPARPAAARPRRSMPRCSCSTRASARS